MVSPVDDGCSAGDFFFAGDVCALAKREEKRKEQRGEIEESSSWIGRDMSRVISVVPADFRAPFIGGL